MLRISALHPKHIIESERTDYEEILALLEALLKMPITYIDVEEIRNAVLRRFLTVLQSIGKRKEHDLPKHEP